MFSRLRRHVSYANIIATLALVFAMSGGALAAKHYLVNSTKQISPSVLKKLKGKTGSKGATGPGGAQGAQGAQGKEGAPGKEGTSIVTRIRGAGPVETSTYYTSPQSYPLTNATWSQGASEAQWIVASVTFTAPPESKCSYEAKLGSAGYAHVEVLIDGHYAASEYVYDEPA